MSCLNHKTLIKAKLKQSSLKTHGSGSSPEFITITFGEVAETHVGMRKEGDIVPVGQGLSPETLENIEKWFIIKGCKTELIDLTTLLRFGRFTNQPVSGFTGPVTDTSRI